MDEGLLGKKEGDDDRYREDDRGRHELVPDHGALALKVLQTECHGEIARAGEKEQWPGESFLRPEEGENGHGG